ncbi:MAG: hypothetical protein NXH97_20760 [Rhodobacteraceae bacterium]|nr:hypothetical protein [Paracoccaceae bacterium]
MRPRAFTRFAAREDGDVRTELRSEGPNLRVIIEIARTRAHPFVTSAEWLNVQGTITAIESFAGADWCPAEIAFVSPHRQSDSARAKFPDTRFLVGQPNTATTVGKALLTQPTIADVSSASVLR